MRVRAKQGRNIYRLHTHMHARTHSVYDNKDRAEIMDDL